MNERLNNLLYAVTVLLVAGTPLVIYPPINSPEAAPKLFYVLVLSLVGALVAGIGTAIRPADRATGPRRRLFDLSLFVLFSLTIAACFMYPGSFWISFLGRDDMGVSALSILSAISATYFASRLTLDPIMLKNLLWFFIWSVMLANVTFELASAKSGILVQVAGSLAASGIKFGYAGSYGSAAFLIGANTAAFAAAMVLLRIEKKKMFLPLAALLGGAALYQMAGSLGVQKTLFIVIAVVLFWVWKLVVKRDRASQAGEEPVQTAGTPIWRGLKLLVGPFILTILAITGLLMAAVTAGPNLADRTWSLHRAETLVSHNSISEIEKLLPRLGHAPLGPGKYSRALSTTRQLERDQVSGHFPLYAGNTWLELALCLGVIFVFLLFVLLWLALVRRSHDQTLENCSPDVYSVIVLAIFLAASTSTPDPIVILLLFLFTGLALSPLRSEQQAFTTSTPKKSNFTQAAPALLFAIALIGSLAFAYMSMSSRASVSKYQKGIDVNALSAAQDSNLLSYPDKITAARIVIFEAFLSKDQTALDNGIEGIKALVKHDPLNLSLREELVDNLVLTDNFEGAKTELGTIQKFAPSDTQTMNGIGYMNFKLGRYNEAIAQYERSLTIDENDRITHALMRDAYIKLGSTDAARVHDLKARMLTE